MQIVLPSINLGAHPRIRVPWKAIALLRKTCFDIRHWSLESEGVCLRMEMIRFSPSHFHSDVEIFQPQAAGWVSMYCCAVWPVLHEVSELLQAPNLPNHVSGAQRGWRFWDFVQNRYFKCIGGFSSQITVTRWGAGGWWSAACLQRLCSMLFWGPHLAVLSRNNTVVVCIFYCIHTFFFFW